MKLPKFCYRVTWVDKNGAIKNSQGRKLSCKHRREITYIQIRTNHRVNRYLTIVSQYNKLIISGLIAEPAAVVSSVLILSSRRNGKLPIRALSLDLNYIALQAH